MAKYDFKCNNEDCGVVQEVIQSVHDPLPEWKKCPACGCRAEHVILPSGAPSISQANLEKQSFDSLIGRDSEKRWENIRERQTKRDKVRHATGQENLTMTGFNEFKPLPADKKLTLVKGLKQENN
jgi:putative FmdB family regulatory protein